jgi:acyl-CoA synthetase (AMP-forming)/AMP-acid ligase II
MDRDTRSRLIRLLPEGTLWEFYGTTETGTIAVLPPDLQTIYGHTVGFPLPGVQIRIVDEQNRELPRDVVGRVAVLTPTMMVGYLTPGGELDQGRRVDGALLVGDLGELTEEGALILHGRADGVIVSGGVKIQAEEVESAMKGCPGVREVVVFGMEDPDWGQRVVALVEPEGEGLLSPEALKESLRTKIASFKIPKEMRFGPIPRTPTGKIARSPELLRKSWGEAGS